MHDDEVRIPVDIARLLIAEQFPAWSGLPVVTVPTAATVNAIFRVGDSMAARFPLRRHDPGAAADQLRREVRAGEEFATVSPFSCPRPLGVGRPDHGYPMPWSVQTWLPGTDATVTDPSTSRRFALDLVTLIRALRSADVAGRRFCGDGRGGHLPDHDEWVDHCFDNSGDLVDTKRLRDLWEQLRTLPEADADVMCHGDLTPPNLLVDDAHRLVGVLDTGGFAPADPALDLVAVWHLLDLEHHDLVRRRLGCGDVQWQRGMAWALQQALGLVWYYAVSNPVMARWGMRTLTRLQSA